MRVRAWSLRRVWWGGVGLGLVRRAGSVASSGGGSGATGGGCSLGGGALGGWGGGGAVGVGGGRQGRRGGGGGGGWAGVSVRGLRMVALRQAARPRSGAPTPWVWVSAFWT